MTVKRSWGKPIKTTCERCGVRTCMPLYHKLVDGEDFLVCQQCIDRMEMKHKVRDWIARGMMTVDQVDWKAV